MIRKLAPTVLAIVLIVACFAYLFASSEPVGNIRGQVLFEANGKPFANGTVRFVLRDSPDDVRYRVHTDAAGRYFLRHVRAGIYDAYTNTEHHETKAGKAIGVAEATTTDADLRLARSERPLSLTYVQQRIFTTKETATVPIQGYAEPGAKLDVTVYRTKLSDVLSQVSSETLRGIGNESTLRLPKRLEPLTRTALTQNAVALTKIDHEGYFVQRIPLDGLTNQPGLFLTRFRLGKETVWSWVLRTDIALVALTSQTDNRQLVQVVDLTTGVAKAGAAVRYLRQGQTIASATTDKGGLAWLEKAPRQAENNGLLVAQLGADEALISGEAYDFGSDDETLVAHTLTDRTIYRPGDTVQYKTIVRERVAPDSYTYRVPSPRNVTVRVTDRTGMELSQETKTLAANGTLTGSFTTSAEGATGFYTLEIKGDGITHTHDIAVVSYKKPEFEVTVTPKQERYRRGETVEATIAGMYYFGAPVAGGKVTYWVYRETDWAAELGESGTDFEEDEYREIAGRYYRGSYGQSVARGEANLDANGRFVVTFPATVEQEDSAADIPQVQKVTISALVTDDAQRDVSVEKDIRVTSADLHVAVRAEGYLATAGSPVTVFASVRDFDGKPQAGKPVQVRLERAHWDAKTHETKYLAAGAPQTATTSANGQADLRFTVTEPGDYQLIATTTDAAGRETRAHGSVWVVSDHDNNLDTSYDDLTLATDKRNYQPGDTAKVMLGTAHTGQTALLTVEGQRIYKAIPVAITSKTTVVSVPVLAEYGPNVTLVARYVRDKKFAETEQPLRVALSARELTVAITPDKTTYEPGQTARYTVRVQDKQGKPVATELAFSVVDEALYALKPDNPRALRSQFYPRRSHGVRSSHSFAIAFLAGDDKDDPVIVARKKFLDTAYWNPSVRTDSTGTATIAVPLPDNLTTWRATAWACTAETTAVGYGSAKVTVNRPFFIRGEVSRFVLAGDDTRILALVHNNTGSDLTANVRCVVGDTPVGSNQKVSVAHGTIGQVVFPWKAPQASETPLKLVLSAWSDDRKVTDAVELPLTIRPFVRRDIVALPPLTESQRFDLPEGLAAANSRLVVRVTPGVGPALSDALTYLVGFPYGCVEQTMSRFMPDILAARYAPEFVPAEQRAALPKMVRDGIARLRDYQQGERGWGWWHHDAPDPFLTAYVLTGLAEARDAGYAVPPILFSEGTKALRSFLKTRASGPQGPFLLYALSRADARSVRLEGVIGATALRNQVAADIRKRSPDALAYLILFSKEVGLDTGGLVAELEKRAVSDSAFVHWPDNGAQDFDSSTRLATALALRALLAARPESPLIPSAVRYLMATRTDGSFGSTRDTAMTVAMLCTYLQQHPEPPVADEPTVTVAVNGTEQHLLPLRQNGRLSEWRLTLPATALTAKNNTLELRSSSGASVFATAELHSAFGAVDGVLPERKRTAVSVRREYLRLASGPKGLIPEAPSSRFAQSDTVRVRLVIENAQPLEYVLIEDFFPSGLEPNARGTVDEDEFGEWSFWYTHVDVRDDRLAVFARTLPAGKHVYEYHLRAQTPGLFRALPTSVTPMYATTLRAESASAQLEVR